MKTSRKRTWPVLLALCAALAAREAGACATPVYQYALAWWLPDDYIVTVFHREPLGKDAEELLSRLEKPVSDALPPANLVVEKMDVSGEMPEHASTLYKTLGPVDLPLLVMQFPMSVGEEQAVWTAPLAAETIDRILDSPVRRKIVEGITRGDVAVWVLVEGGNREKDDAAAAVLEKELKLAEKELKEAAAQEPPPLDHEETGEEDEVLPISYSFTVVRLRRSDPAEQVLLAMLMRTEPDLAKHADEPITFPVFGQGRALYPLVGKGIEPYNIRGACWFMSGPCACEVKMMNPGVDLLIAANWEKALENIAAVEESVPELTGVFPLGDGTTNTTTGAEDGQPPEQEAGPGDARQSAPFAKTVGFVLAGLIVLAVIAGMVMIRRGES